MEKNEKDLDSQKVTVKSEESTNSVPVKTANVKLPVALAIVLVVILIAFLVLSSRSVKSTVKNYIAAFNKADSNKVMSLMDFEGIQVFNETKNKLENFDETYKNIMKDLKKLDKEKKKEYNQLKNGTKDTIQASLDILKNANIKYSISNIRTEKVNGSKKLTKVTCAIKVKYKDEEIEREVTFYTMKKGLRQYIVSSSL